MTNAYFTDPTAGQASICSQVFLIASLLAKCPGAVIIKRTKPSISSAEALQALRATLAAAGATCWKKLKGEVSDGSNDLLCCRATAGMAKSSPSRIRGTAASARIASSSSRCPGYNLLGLTALTLKTVIECRKKHAHKKKLAILCNSCIHCK